MHLSIFTIDTGYSRYVWHNDQELELETSIERWKASDVVGCLIEVVKNSDNNKEKKFSFYLNGKLISYTSDSPIYSSPHLYYASVSLSSHQHVWINFGQTEFLYPPDKDYLSLCHSLEYPIQKSSSINMSNSKVTNSIFLFDSNNTMGNVWMSNNKFASSSTIDDSLKKGLTFECITCSKCDKEILLKKIFLDCCPCLKLSIKTETGNKLLTITDQSTSEFESTSNSLDNCPNKRKMSDVKHPLFTNLDSSEPQASNSTKRYKLNSGDCIQGNSDDTIGTMEVDIPPNSSENTSVSESGPLLSLLLPQFEKLTKEEMKQCIAKLMNRL